MTSATQPKPNPLPAILVYGTPSSPALTQASWFRAEDKEAAKAAAEALKFSVIELQTDAEKALTIGVHEGVVKRIDHGEFTRAWFDGPEYPAFKSRPQDIAVPHPEFRVSGK